MRVLPGRLSVSRTFGDIEAKLTQFGGNPNCVVATPEITSFKLNTSLHDFIVLGCDGIFDKMSNEDITQCVWNSVNDNKTMKVANNIHKQTGMAVEYILKNSLLRRTLDNVTVVMISFKNFKHTCFGEDKPDPTIDRTINMTMDDAKMVFMEGTSITANNNSLASSSQRTKENIPPQTGVGSDENSSTAFNKARVSMAGGKAN